MLNIEEFAMRDINELSGGNSRKFLSLVHCLKSPMFFCSMSLLLISTSGINLK